MKNNLLPIAKEGWDYVFASFGVFIFFWIIDLEILQALSFIALILFILIFRNPERELPHFEAKSVLSPVDGRVIAIESLEEEKYAFKITVDSSYQDVGVLRSPITALAVESKKMHGSRLAQNSKLFHDLNEKLLVKFENDDGDILEVQHRLKQSFTSLDLDILKFKTLVQTQRYGFMAHGVTEIFLPYNFRLDVKVFDELKASESLVGYFS